MTTPVQTSAFAAAIATPLGKTPEEAQQMLDEYAAAVVQPQIEAYMAMPPAALAMRQHAAQLKSQAEQITQMAQIAGSLPAFLQAQTQVQQEAIRLLNGGTEDEFKSLQLRQATIAAAAPVMQMAQQQMGLLQPVPAPAPAPAPRQTVGTLVQPAGSVLPYVIGGAVGSVVGIAAPLILTPTPAAPVVAGGLVVGAAVGLLAGHMVNQGLTFPVLVAHQ